MFLSLQGTVYKGTDMLLFLSTQAEYLLAPLICALCTQPEAYFHTSSLFSPAFRVQIQ